MPRQTYLRLLFYFAQGDKGYRLTASCYCSLLTESYYLFERRQRKRANQQGVTMKPETNSTTKLETRTKQPVSSRRQNTTVHVTTSLSSGASCTELIPLAGSATSARPHFSTYSDLQAVEVCEHGRGVF